MPQSRCKRAHAPLGAGCAISGAFAIYGRRPCSEHATQERAQREPSGEAAPESEAFPLPNRPPQGGFFVGWGWHGVSSSSVTLELSADIRSGTAHIT